jgi:HPt (histidine-containing phosphotransfer) domain-containing protein
MSLNLNSLESAGFDMNRVAELVDLFESEQEVFNLVQEMYSDSTGIVDEIQACIEAANDTAAMQKSHYLKGVASGVGARAISEAAIKLEDRLREKSDHTTEIERLRAAWKALANILTP